MAEEKKKKEEEEYEEVRKMKELAEKEAMRDAWERYKRRHLK
ncbi:MAG: hypothetical protein QW061_03165 [Candidatus Rehaiarchaeum fermentans]|nr:hypothetical protein [Candidatus Rehaiarchaeum fermentans]